MRRLNYLTGIIFAGVLLLFSCKRDEFSPYFGPQACPEAGFAILAGQEFTMSKSDPQTVDFSAGQNLTLTAQFNSNAPWKIEITGVLSHAKRIVEGYSSTVSYSWYGRPTGEVFFVDETVKVVFSIRCREDLTVTRYVKIKTGDFSSDPEVHFYSDFDGLTGPAYGYVGANVYPGAVADSAYCPHTSKPGFCTNYTPSPFGGAYLTYKGTQPILSGPDKNIYGDIELGMNTLNFSSNPSDVWFNFYARSGTNPVKLVIVFAGGGKYSLTIHSTAWKMYSINLGSLEGTPASFDPSNMGYISMVVVQSEALSPTEVNIDYISFTEGESFLGENL